MNRITTILLAVLFLVSCSKDYDDVINVDLEGKWTLTEAYCYCAFNDTTDFSVHKIIFEGSTLMVKNSGDPKFLNDASGSYQVDGNLISLPNGSKFRYAINGDVLTLIFVDNPNIADDELTLAYRRG
tara:strand:- start:762 stop:1142 length:381 start_codon:yes stop_codon:yes gene_type:complete